MKRFIASVVFFCTLIFTPSLLSAQGRIHLSVGVNGSYAGLDSLNFIIDKFNEDNPEYPKLLNNIHAPMGIYVNAGANFSRFLLDLSFTMRTQGARARSVANPDGTDQRVHMRYNAHTFEVGTGYYFVNGDYTRLALGVSLDFGQTRLLGRRGVSTQVSTFPWGQMTNELNFSSSIFLQAMFVLQDNPRIGIYFRPYYQFGFVRNDFGQVNRFLRPNNWQSDPFFILQSPSNVGLKAGVFIGN